MEKKIGKRVYFSWGKLYGFGIGINVSKYFSEIQLGFWYIGLEY